MFVAGCDDGDAGTTKNDLLQILYDAETMRLAGELKSADRAYSEFYNKYQPLTSRLIRKGKGNEDTFIFLKTLTTVAAANSLAINDRLLKSEKSPVLSKLLPSKYIMAANNFVSLNYHAVKETPNATEVNNKVRNIFDAGLVAQYVRVGNKWSAKKTIDRIRARIKNLLIAPDIPSTLRGNEDFSYLLQAAMYHYVVNTRELVYPSEYEHAKSITGLEHVPVRDSLFVQLKLMRSIAFARLGMIDEAWQAVDEAKGEHAGRKWSFPNGRTDTMILNMEASLLAITGNKSKAIALYEKAMDLVKMIVGSEKINRHRANVKKLLAQPSISPKLDPRSASFFMKISPTIDIDVDGNYKGPRSFEKLVAFNLDMSPGYQLSVELFPRPPAK